MVSGDLQSMQEPVWAQGVDSPNRWALMGAATFRARFMALSRSGQILFMPTMKTTFRGPWAMAETRFALPSMLMSTRPPSWR